MVAREVKKLSSRGRLAAAAAASTGKVAGFCRVLPPHRGCFQGVEILNSQNREYFRRVKVFSHFFR